MELTFWTNYKNGRIRLENIYDSKDDEDKKLMRNSLVPLVHTTAGVPVYSMHDAYKLEYNDCNIFDDSTWVDEYCQKDVSDYIDDINDQIWAASYEEE